VNQSAENIAGNLAERRVAALEEYSIMDTPSEAAFDDITRLTGFICGTPIALVSLLDKERQWFKSRLGMDAAQTPIDQAFCTHAIRQEKVFVVPDATRDSRFSNNPLVTAGPGIRFYAGAPLVNPDGVPLGTLCAIDRTPRTFTPEQSDALSALARQVIYLLELRRTVARLRVAVSEKQAAIRQVEDLKELLPMCAWCKKVRDDSGYWQQVELFINTQTGSDVTHGICPDCAVKLTGKRL
jgi:GAF domain-containing protein